MMYLTTQIKFKRKVSVSDKHFDSQSNRKIQRSRIYLKNKLGMDQREQEIQQHFLKI